VGTAAFGSTQSPSFTTREAETTVVVQDGDAIIIGGIIDDTIMHNRSGVPFIMDIPVIGRLFRTESDTTTRTELIILITPYVIRHRGEGPGPPEAFGARSGGPARLRRALGVRTHRPSKVEEEPAPPVRGPGILPPPVR